MVTAGHSAPSKIDSLWKAVCLDVVVARGQWLDASWDYEICSPFWRLYVHRQAGGELKLAGRRMALSADVVYLLPAGVRFHTRLKRGVKKVWQDYIHFEVSGLPQPLVRRLFPSPLNLFIEREIAGPLTAWRAGIDSGSEDPAQRLRSLALVHTAFAQACDAVTAADQGAWVDWLALPPMVAPALRRIEESLESPPPNSELAQLCGLGVRQFLRRFQSGVGMSPGQYALERRITLAADALARSNEAIETIAVRLGFADRFYFSKVFKLRVGLPPAAYRTMHGVRRGVWAERGRARALR